MEFLRSGIVASTIANCHRGKNQAAFKPSDFMPPHDKPAGQTMEETKAKMNAAMALITQKPRRKKSHG